MNLNAVYENSLGTSFTAQVIKEIPITSTPKPCKQAASNKESTGRQIKCDIEKQLLETCVQRFVLLIRHLNFCLCHKSVMEI